MTTARLTKPALGVLMGASIALAASAVAGQAGSSWFSGSFATGGSGSAGTDQALLAQTDAAMSAQLKADAENCDQLGIGASIRTAIGAHSEMAAARPNHHPDIIPSANENGYSLLVNHKFGDKIEAQALWIASLNRNDWMLRPRVSWNFEKNWRLALGVDVFNGPPLGDFGRYDAKDRVYSELRYSF